MIYSDGYLALSVFPCVSRAEHGGGGSARALSFLHRADLQRQSVTAPLSRATVRDLGATSQVRSSVLSQAIRISLCQTIPAVESRDPREQRVAVGRDVSRVDTRRLEGSE